MTQKPQPDGAHLPPQDKLLFGIILKSPKTVEIALAEGANPNKLFRGTQLTIPIHAAAHYGSMAIINALVVAGADILKADADGRTALTYTQTSTHLNPDEKAAFARLFAEAATARQAQAQVKAIAAEAKRTHAVRRNCRALDSFRSRKPMPR